MWQAVTQECKVTSLSQVKIAHFYVMSKKKGLSAKQGAVYS